jgi:hypothetical protein
MIRKREGERSREKEREREREGEGIDLEGKIRYKSTYDSPKINDSKRCGSPIAISSKRSVKLLVIHNMSIISW